MAVEQTKPRIAIPQPTAHNAAYNMRCWPQYAEAVATAGGDAIEIPLSLLPDDAAKLIGSCHGVLLPGSPADVSPQKYGQVAVAESATPDPVREAMDELLLQDAFHLRKPLLGICFGLQMINVWRGGTLTQHLCTALAHAPLSDQAPLSHALELDPRAPLLASLFSGAIRPWVNSSHHQAVERPGDGLRVSARASGDGTIEAVEYPEHPFCLGVQWHPERTYAEDASSQALFTRFVEAARQWRLPQG